MQPNQGSYRMDARGILTPGNSSIANIEKLVVALEALGNFSDNRTFNSFCRGALAAWDKAFPQGLGRIDQFTNIISDIDAGKVGSAGLKPIQVPWGGVWIALHNPPQVEKYLAIRKGGYLAFETHELKQEHLQVREGAGLLIYRASQGKPLQLKLLLPGVEASFAPGQEHCIIGTENLLVYETSTDPKGMDKDLIFIFTAE